MSDYRYSTKPEGGRITDETSRDPAHSQRVQSLEQSFRRLSGLSQPSPPYVSPYAPIPPRREPARSSVPSSRASSSSARNSPVISRAVSVAFLAFRFLCSYSYQNTISSNSPIQYSPAATSTMSSGKAISAAGQFDQSFDNRFRASIYVFIDDLVL